MSSTTAVEQGAGAAGDEPASIAVLRQRGVAFVLVTPVQGARTLPEFAGASGLRPGQVIKSLLLDVNGERQALLVVAGDRSADFAALRRHFGVRSVRLADPETVLQVTGYRIGTVTPLALKSPDVPVVIDAALVAEPVVSLGTGVPGRHVRLAGRDLPVAVQGTAGAFAK